MVYSEKFLSDLAGCLYDSLLRREVEPGFTVGDIVRAGIPLINNSMLASIALQRLITDGAIKVRVEHDGKSKELRYYLRYPHLKTEKEEPKAMCKGKQCCNYKTREMRSESPSRSQVGGTHYTDMQIQPIDYIVKNGIGFLEGNVIKYVSRWKAKGGTEDLKKARHCIDLLLEQTGETH